MSTVLLVGEDELLQQTRAAVLRTTGAETICANAASALAVLADRVCDLVVLCHSLPERLASALAQAIRSRWPGTPVLRVTSKRLWELPESDTAINSVTSADPERLISRTAELLRSRDRAHKPRNSPVRS
jgi:CheY-like chemotaxis protein